MLLPRVLCYQEWGVFFKPPQCQTVTRSEIQASEHVYSIVQLGPNPFCQHQCPEKQDSLMADHFRRQLDGTVSAQSWCICSNPPETAPLSLLTSPLDLQSISRAAFLSYTVTRLEIHSPSLGTVLWWVASGCSFGTAFFFLPLFAGTDSFPVV